MYQHARQETEEDFYAALHELSTTLGAGGDVVPVIEAWHERVAAMAEDIFDDLSQTGAFDAVDPRRVALAWLGLRREIRGKKIRGLLGLPESGRQKAGDK